MRMICLLASALLVLGASPDRRRSLPSQPTGNTICELKKRAMLGRHEVLPVSVTAVAFLDFEQGLFLAEFGCDDPIDGTGLLPISLPAGKGFEDFPELSKLNSQPWLASSIGKKVYCTCIGTATFDDGKVTFVLREAKAVWASDL